MNGRPEQPELEEIALLTGIVPSYIEKDWFVTQVVAALAAFRYEGFEFIFAGGTALSKAHKLIQRFSEDVDFSVIAPQDQQSRKALSQFKKLVLAHLRKSGFTIADRQVMARNDNRLLVFEFDYPSYFNHPAALRPHVQIEMVVRVPQYPRVSLPISSFVNAAYNRPPEVDRIACIDPVESAADKLSALAWRIPARIRGHKQDDPSLVRHLHDLALLKSRALADEKFADLVKTSMQIDDRRTPLLTGLSIGEKFRVMLERLETDREYQAEYDTFVRGVSYAQEGEFPDFTTAMEAMRELVLGVEVRLE